MLEVQFGMLSTVGDILAPTPAARWFWSIFGLMAVIAVVAAIA